MEQARIVIARGHPTPAEVAAVVAALDARPRTAEPATVAASGSRWIRAARLEASGHPPIESPMRLPR